MRLQQVYTNSKVFEEVSKLTGSCNNYDYELVEVEQSQTLCMIVTFPAAHALTSIYQKCKITVEGKRFFTSDHI